VMPEITAKINQLLWLCEDVDCLKIYHIEWRALEAYSCRCRCTYVALNQSAWHVQGWWSSGPEVSLIMQCCLCVLLLAYCLHSAAASHSSRTLLLTSCPSACAVCTGEGTGASGVTCKSCVNNLQVLKTNNPNTNGACGEWWQ
jgi:hypothetical protein